MHELHRWDILQLDRCGTCHTLHVCMVGVGGWVGGTNSCAFSLMSARNICGTP
jgi:hypothetical protein